MFEFLVGDFAVVAGVIMAVVAFWRLFPYAVKRIWNDDGGSLSLVNRAVIIASGLMVIWIALFDNWRQVIGIPTGWIQDDEAQRASDPFYTGDISDPVRAVSWVLFFVAVFGGAYFFAKFARGYAEPLILGPVSVVTFFVLNTFRLRFDVDSVRIAYGTIESPIDIVMTLLWVGALWVTMALLVTAMYLMAWGPFALLFSFIYRRFIDRHEYVEPEMYKRIRERRMSGAQRG